MSVEWIRGINSGVFNSSNRLFVALGEDVNLRIVGFLLGIWNLVINETFALNNN
jgi:hypothetical protein